MSSPPAAAGDPIAAIDTPALVLDLDPFERNLDALAAATRGRGVALRPHAKAHKCPEIARAQLARGAVGVCCQKVAEAEVFVAAGVRDVLVTNEIVGTAKLARLAALAKAARIGVLADDAGNVAALGHAARAAGVVLEVLVEIDVGAHRCGVLPGAAAVALATAIAATPGLRFGGIHAYHGAAQHLRTPAERATAIAGACAAAAATKAAIEAAGLVCPSITGAGTGTWRCERDSGVYTELQPGSYVFMDADYGRNTPAEGDLIFEHSLYVLATVMSAPVPTRIVVDAGLKAFSFDSGPPRVADVPWLARAHRDGDDPGAPPATGVAGLVYAKASDEHGVIDVAPGARAPLIGEAVALIPGHCDPTVNLYDWLVAIRGERVEALWPIAARGAGG